ncbi:hypothetical protein M231_05018 [Tremella mesenterica]|uniref:Uncharacterized protein n=1 Tax=Tremella mesenterica TaxID=5217 RepID=A0A4Q1BJ78_TREME|nr:hypothetical protein M231_05018 [Tremella mesenterica]
MTTQHQGSMPDSHFQDKKNPSMGSSTPMPFLGDMLAGGSFKGLAVNINHWTPKHPYEVISETPDGSMKTFVYHFPKFARISETTGKLHMAVCALALTTLVFSSIGPNGQFKEVRQISAGTSIVLAGKMPGSETERKLYLPNPTTAAVGLAILGVRNLVRVIVQQRQSDTYTKTPKDTFESILEEIRKSADSRRVDESVTTSFGRFFDDDGNWKPTRDMRHLSVVPAAKSRADGTHVGQDGDLDFVELIESEGLS